MARFGDGLAVDADLARAAERASLLATRPLAGRRPDLACVFVCGDDPEAVAAAGAIAARTTGAGMVLGCSAPGVIGGGRGVEASSAVAVWAGVLPGVRLRGFHLEVMRTPSGMAVVGLPERTGDDAVCLLLADPYSFPVDGFVQRVNATLDGLPIVGGVATGSRGPGSTRLFLDGRAVDRGAVGVVLGGPVAALPLVSQGCRPVGPAMTVTAADANVLLGLAGTPALDKLEQVLRELPPADQALASSGLHIGVAIDEYAEDQDQGDFLVRGIVGSDAARRGLVVGDIVPIGRTVRFQVRDAASAGTDLYSTLRRFRTEGPLDSVEGALLFSCNGRGAGLFATADHDVTAVRSTLSTAGVAGCFAAGEIGPVGGRNYLHGFTASMLVFGSGQTANRGTVAQGEVSHG